MSAPSSIINICSGVRLNSDYNHTIWFDSASAQQSYFAGKVVKTFSAYSYLRKNWNIKVESNMETARTWSYLYFRNGSGKYYYYFITNIQYINDSTVELSLELDVMQTYLFDYTLLRSFVEREHTSSDVIGANIVEEGLEIGDLRVIDETEFPMEIFCILVLATFDPLGTTAEHTETVLGMKYNDVFSGLGVYAVALQDWIAWSTKLAQLDEWGKSDGIISMWMYPADLVTLADGLKWTDGKVCKDVKAVGSLYHDISRNDKTSGAYTPRNRKLLTYPYNFLYATNNSGTAAVYRYERFGDPTACNFRLIGSLSPDASARLYPLNYNGVQHNYEEGLELNGFPTCAWNQDVYKLWLAQNQNQQNLGYAMAGLKIAGGVATAILGGGLTAGAGLGTALSGASDIANMLAQKSDKEIQPPQAKGNTSTSVAYANDFQTFVLKRKSIGIEYARILDDYFDMYGYKTLQVKVPNRHVRENWTYTKTVGCSISGNFCNEDKVKIESIFDKGVTFWVNGDSIGNYALSNNTL